MVSLGSRRTAHERWPAQRYIADGYNIVVDLDLEKFFDRLNHDSLMARVAARVSGRHRFARSREIRFRNLNILHNTRRTCMASARRRHSDRSRSARVARLRAARRSLGQRAGHGPPRDLQRASERNE